MKEFLHERSDFGDLLLVASDQHGITPALIEKDYWIMHCLWGLKAQRLPFELKGGTSLSKGFGIIKRFSEDLDIRFEPAKHLQVKTGKNHDKPAQIESRKKFFDWLAEHIRIPGMLVKRATEYGDGKLRNGGIRLVYPTRTAELSGIKPGILLEVGFDDTTPNTSVDISSWAFETASANHVPIQDNRATGILCYNAEYTFVEKLQTVSTKYRQFLESQTLPANFLRHYYDIYCLLEVPSVKEFIGTPEYDSRKKKRFRTGDELQISKNRAFLFGNQAEYAQLEHEYNKTTALYYAGQPTLAQIASRIKEHIDNL